MARILVVDDKDSMRNMLTETLMEEGYRVDSASDGKRALDLVRNKSYDLVLTDLKMPNLDGLSLLTGIKEVDGETSVIVMTAYGTVETAVTAMKQGAYDSITKPFDTEHLCVLVNRALENRRMMAENILLREELLEFLERAIGWPLEDITYTYVFQGFHGNGELLIHDSVDCPGGRERILPERGDRG